MRETWKLIGYDEFDGEYYPLEGDYTSEKEVLQAGSERLIDLEKTQPSSHSGGQSGIQDRVFIQRPDGSQYRLFTPVPQEDVQQTAK